MTRIAPSPEIIAQMDALYARHGPLDHVMPGPDPEPWIGRLPDALLYFWEIYGLGTWRDGRMHIIDPQYAAPLVEFLFAGDPDFAGDTHAIAIGAFGQMTLWSERHGLVDFNTMMTAIEAPYLIAPQSAPPPDTQIADGFLDIPPQMLEAYGADSQQLFDPVRKLLGPLEPVMIYASTPAPPTASDLIAKNFVLADAREWIEAVITENSTTLVDWQSESPDLRLIGDPWPDGHSLGTQE